MTTENDISFDAQEDAMTALRLTMRTYDVDTLRLMFSMLVGMVSQKPGNDVKVYLDVIETAMESRGML